MIYLHGRHSVPIVCLCPFYLCCKSCCWGFKTIHWCTFSWLVSCFNWCFVDRLVFHGLLVALMNVQVGPKEVLALCNSFGILARTTMNFILTNGRWFSLMCHFHMCSFGSSFTINSAIFPSSNMYTSSSMSACRKAPGMSAIATCLFSFASMVHDIIIASSDTVGELVSDFVVYSLCDLPSAQPLALIVPSRFYFKNIR